MKDLQSSIDAAARSKICARNYKDQEVPDELIEHLLKVATGGPYKQGRRYFDVYAITNPDKCKEIWNPHTARPDEANRVLTVDRVNKDGTPATFIGNAQVLAPVLFVFMRCDPTPEYPKEDLWNPSDQDMAAENEVNGMFAIGTAMGMLTYEANRQGLHTGNCFCFEPRPVTDLMQKWTGRTINLGKAYLLVGAGYPQEEWKGPENALQMREHSIVEDHSYHTRPSDREDPQYYRIT